MIKREAQRRALVTDFKKVESWLYGGDKEAPVIRCRSIEAVVVRFSQLCCSPYHKKPQKHPAGTLMVVERAVIDGEWRSCYTCRGCIEKSLEELEWK